MSAVTIRNLSPTTLKAIKSLAKRHGRSMEQELRMMIEAYAVDRRSVLARIKSRRRNGFRYRISAEDIDAAIEEGRT